MGNSETLANVERESCNIWRSDRLQCAMGPLSLPPQARRRIYIKISPLIPGGASGGGVGDS
eukprot:3570752-Pyramimonas_sp.AAC.1